MVNLFRSAISKLPYHLSLDGVAAMSLLFCVSSLTKKVVCNTVRFLHGFARRVATTGESAGGTGKSA
jgi:hypothetical protein